MNASILFALAAAVMAVETSPEGVQKAVPTAVADASAVEDCFKGGWGGMGGGMGGGGNQASDYTTVTFASTSLFSTEIDFTSTQVVTIPGSTYYVTARPTQVVSDVAVTSTYTSVVNNYANGNRFANFADGQNGGRFGHPQGFGQAAGFAQAGEAGQGFGQAAGFYHPYHYE